MSPSQPDNILMVYPPRDEIKICDFGFCQEIDTSRHQYSMLGTPEFVAPEIVHLEPVTVATDIWWVSLTKVTFSARLLDVVAFIDLFCSSPPQVCRCYILHMVGTSGFYWYSFNLPASDTFFLT